MMTSTVKEGRRSIGSRSTVKKIKEIHRVKEHVRSEERPRQARKALQDEKFYDINPVMMSHILLAFIHRESGKAGLLAHTAPIESDLVPAALSDKDVILGP